MRSSFVIAGVSLAYALGLLTGVLVYLIFYALARSNPGVATSYRRIFCSSLPAGNNVAF